MAIAAVAAAPVELREDTPDVIIRPELLVGRAIDQYLDEIDRRGYAERTQATYSRMLDQFADSLPVDCDVSKVTGDDIRRYLGRFRGKAQGTKAHAESVLASFFKWLYFERKIARNPFDRIARTRRVAAADLDVVTVSSDDVRLLLFHAETWPERLAIGILVYLGPRRRAVAHLRLADYDRARKRMRFREKGGKVIWKPVPDELDSLIEAAIAAGVYDTTDYLVPPRAGGYLTKRGDRDDRVIWDIVKTVAARAGVETHVHALRAAFAVFYLEQNPGDTKGLQELLGHKSPTTTDVYLRKLNKERAMEPVRSLSWGVSITDNPVPSESPEIAKDRLA